MKIENYRFVKNQLAKDRSRDIFAEEIIDSLTPPCSDREKRHIAEMINAEANQLGAAYRQEKLAPLGAVKAEKDYLDARVREQGDRLKEAEQEFADKRASRGSLIVFTFLSLCLVVCLVAEASLTRNTLPYILDVKRNSFEGWMLALVTVAAVGTLEIVIGTLIWNRWHVARSHKSLAVRIAGWLLISCFLLSIGWLNIHTLSAIAPAREEVVKLQRNLDLPEEVKPEPVDWKKIDAAIFWVSMAAAINGALLFLIATKELNTAYWRILLAVLLLRFRQRRLKKKQSRAEARLNTLQDAWEHIDERVHEIIEGYRSRLLIRLDQALKGPHQLRPYLQRVNEILAARINR